MSEHSWGGFAFEGCIKRLSVLQCFSDAAVTPSCCVCRKSGVWDALQLQRCVVYFVLDESGQVLVGTRRFGVVPRSLLIHDVASKVSSARSLNLQQQQLTCKLQSCA
jgi:hypothetical protein